MMDQFSSLMSVSALFAAVFIFNPFLSTMLSCSSSVFLNLMQFYVRVIPLKSTVAIVNAVG